MEATTEALEVIPEEKTEFERFERIIAQGIVSFLNVAEALIQIRDKQYYKKIAGYGTFGEYCEKKWGMTRQRAYQLIDAKQVADNLSNNLTKKEIEEIPATQLCALKDVAPEDQPTVYHLAKETAHGKLTAAHVEKTVREIKETSLKTYRILDIAANEWWEGTAKTVEGALEAARGSSFGSSKAKWSAEGCDIKEKTLNGAGGWKKVSVPGEKTPSLSRSAAPVKNPFQLAGLVGTENPADLVQKIINLIDTITDDNPRCKEALARIALHVWNRQHRIEAA